MATVMEVIICIALVAGLTHGSVIQEVADARNRITSDFLEKLYGEISDVQSGNIYNMLHLYSQSTLEQTHQVVEYFESHANLTRAKSASLRLASNNSAETADCVLKGELALLQSFRNTGYNLHNCIRAAQLAFEKNYADLNAKLDALKVTVIRTGRFYHSTLGNCADSDCVMKTLIQAVVRYEAFREELEKERMAGHNLSSRYIVKSIATGCVASALTQIRSNYNVGTDLMSRCFHNQTAHKAN